LSHAVALKRSRGTVAGRTSSGSLNVEVGKITNPEQQMGHFFVLWLYHAHSTADHLETPQQLVLARFDRYLFRQWLAKDQKERNTYETNQ
jgi:hypothetical protein